MRWLADRLSALAEWLSDVADGLSDRSYDWERIRRVGWWRWAADKLVPYRALHIHRPFTIMDIDRRLHDFWRPHLMTALAEPFNLNGTNTVLRYGTTGTLSLEITTESAEADQLARAIAYHEHVNMLDVRRRIK